MLLLGRFHLGYEGYGINIKISSISTPYWYRKHVILTIDTPKVSKDIDNSAKPASTKGQWN